MKKTALIALAIAQFVMVLDQSVMNVSISQLVADFDTTVPTIQAVITLYCLVMAMLMLTGGNPRGTTSVLQYLLYDKSFNLFEFGQGAAIGLITAALILLTTLILTAQPDG